MAIQSDLKNLNPLLNSNTTDVFVERLMFEPLLTADPKGNPLPMLAAVVPTLQNGGISADGLTITYRLRRGAKWTDGVPVTSRDVKWSWQAIMNPDNNVVSRHGYDVIVEHRHSGRKHRGRSLEEALRAVRRYVFCRKRSAVHDRAGTRLSALSQPQSGSFRQRPIGQRWALQIVEWARGDHIALERNDAFFLGRPHLDRIDVRIVPDENTSVNLLRTHSIDYMFQASIENYEALRNVSDVRIVWANVNDYYYTQLNLARPNLSDPRVRLAIAYAIDKNELERTLSYGTQTVATADIPNLDVGLQSEPPLVSPRSGPGSSDSARRRVGAGPRRDHAKGRQRAATRHGDEQLQCDAPEGSDRGSSDASGGRHRG